MASTSLFSHCSCNIPLLAKTINSQQKSADNKIVYRRTTETAKSTTGSFTIAGTEISGYIIEPAGPSTIQSNTDRRIPGGVYNLIKNTGTKFGLRLYNAQVPQSRAILIHSGNFPGDTEGCLLPGTGIGVNSVSSSRNLVKKIMDHFEIVGYAGASITITEINGTAT